MSYLIGLGIATFSLFIALDHLNQGPSHYWDFVAFAIVLGGSISVAIIITPWKLHREIFKYTRRLFLHWTPSRNTFLKHSLEVMELYRNGNKVPHFQGSNIEYKLLNDGFDLLALGFEPKRIQLILQERADQYLENGENIFNTARSLAKYPPAFGLTGTVLGLVELMRAVSAGMPAKDTGIKMAIALVATLYGLLVANLLINPASEQLKKILRSEEKMCDIAIQVILLSADNASLLEAQEMLNSMVASHEQINVFHENIHEEAA